MPCDIPSAEPETKIRNLTRSRNGVSVSGHRGLDLTMSLECFRLNSNTVPMEVMCGIGCLLLGTFFTLLFL